ncbi:unnamed protein product [Sphagnum troendelagicum]|uniref:Protein DETOXIFICATION n=1 Tax=Sphagnum troendelagicum TaxID=128251 RepID=A0ABP0U2H4_9BRYO
MAHFCSSHAGGCRGISNSPMDAGKLRSYACDFPSCSMRHMKLNNTSSDCIIASSCESHTGLTGSRSCPITLDAQDLPFSHRPHSLRANCGHIRTCNFNSCSHLISVTSCLKRETISQKANSYLHHQDLNVLKHAPLLTIRSPSKYVLLRQRRTLTGELVTRIRSRRPETDTEAVLGTVKEGGNPLWGFFENASNAFTRDGLGVEIASIALPAALALAADPLASLVDTAFIGQIGPVELAAVGVSISVFNLVSKMFNIPLLNITTSFVAEDAFQEDKEEVDAGLETREPRKPLLPSVSSALVLGTFLGVGEAFVLAFLAGPVLTVMGVSVMSPMRTPAFQYLALRAIGAPAVVIALAVQGVFRGFKDTKTPLYASLAGNAINIVLDPILMFSLQFGVGGAAVATVASQYAIAGLLLWNLNKRVVLLPPQLNDLRFDRFLKSGGLLIGRTVALLMVLTLATSMAARQGTMSMAAHQICMQIWLATSLLSDSLALAGQAIVASAFAQHDHKRAKEVSFRVLQIGAGFGTVMALILWFGMPVFSRLFTSDSGVLESIALLIPFVALTQPINALAFVFDGLHYGASDFGYVAYSMMLLVIPSGLLLLFLPKIWGIQGVWVGLTLVMGLRMVAGFARLGTATGPWRFLTQEKKNFGLHIWQC